MQTVTIPKALFSLFALMAGSFLLAFTKPAGGEGFEIFLNSKVVVQKFGGPSNKIQVLSLGQASANDQLTVKYYHCGRAGTNRTLTLKNSKNEVVKQWSFRDGKSGPSMTIHVKEILEAQQKAGGQKLGLHYASGELTGGRMLALLPAAQTNYTKL